MLFKVKSVWTTKTNTLFEPRGKNKMLREAHLLLKLGAYTTEKLDMRLEIDKYQSKHTNRLFVI